MYEDCPFRFLAHAVISSTEKIDPVDGKPGAQLTDFLPKTTYIDGVDQAGILLADNGESARRSRIYTLNQYFAMIRIDEFKYIWTAEIQNGLFQKGNWGGFSGP